jgi:hypothetical protein
MLIEPDAEPELQIAITRMDGLRPEALSAAVLGVFAFQSAS